MQGSFVSYLDYLWHDMQMKRAMNIKDWSVYGGAVVNELGDRPAWHTRPPPARHPDLAASKTPAGPQRGRRGAVGTTGGGSQRLRPSSPSWAALALSPRHPPAPRPDPAPCPRAWAPGETLLQPMREE